MRIDQDSWEEWQAHPITEALMKVCRTAVARSREEWTAMTFDRGSCDPIELAKLRARAVAFKEISEMTREQVEEYLE